MYFNKDEVEVLREPWNMFEPDRNKDSTLSPGGISGFKGFMLTFEEHEDEMSTEEQVMLYTKSNIDPKKNIIFEEFLKIFETRIRIQGTQENAIDTFDDLKNSDGYLYLKDFYPIFIDEIKDVDQKAQETKELGFRYFLYWFNFLDENETEKIIKEKKDFNLFTFLESKGENKISFDDFVNRYKYLFKMKSSEEFVVYEVYIKRDITVEAMD